MSSLFLTGLEAMESESVEVFSASTDTKTRTTLFRYLDLVFFLENMPVSNMPSRMPEFCSYLFLFFLVVLMEELAFEAP